VFRFRSGEVRLRIMRVGDQSLMGL